jgi:hypothetical protein
MTLVRVCSCGIMLVVGFQGLLCHICVVPLNGFCVLIYSVVGLFVLKKFYI